MWAWSMEEKFAEMGTNAVLNSNSLITVFAVQIDNSIITEVEFNP